MDLQTTLKLLDAGYTKEENNQMSTHVIDSPKTPAITPEPKKDPEPTQAPTTPGQTPAPTNAETNKIISDLTKQVADLAGVVKGMQDANAKEAQQSTPAKDTAQSVLESFFGKPI